MEAFKEVTHDTVHAMYSALQPTNNTFAVRLNQSQAEPSILLDSGALGGNNYITPAAVLILKHYNMLNTDCSCDPVTVCSAFNTCKHNNECVNLSIQIYHKLYPDRSTHITTTARVVEGLKFPIVLGLGTIREYNLCEQYPEYFGNKSLSEIVTETFQIPVAEEGQTTQSPQVLRGQGAIANAPSRSYKPSRAQFMPSRTAVSSSPRTAQLHQTKKRLTHLQHTENINLILQ
jgi:hypothetical protein